MKTFTNTILALLVVLSILAGSMMPASAQRIKSDTTFVSEVNGWVINLGTSGEAEFIHDRHTINQLGNGNLHEFIYISIGWSTLIVEVSNFYDLPERWLDEPIVWNASYNSDGIEVLGRDGTTENGWSLMRGHYYATETEMSYHEVHLSPEGGSFVNFYLMTHESTLVSHVEWAQENITVNEMAILPLADVNDIQAMLDGTSEYLPERIYGFDSSVDDWSEVGLLSETEWTSPEYDVQVSWDGESIYFPFRLQHAVDFLEDGTSRITLYSQNPAGRVRVNIFPNANELTQQDREEYLASEEFAASQPFEHPPLGTKSDDNVTSVIYVWNAYYETGIVYIGDHRELSDGLILNFSINASEGDIIDLYFSAFDNVEVDGELLEPFWTRSELETLIGNERRVPDTSIRADRTAQTEEIHADVAVSEISGATIKIDTSNGLAFLPDGHVLDQGSGVDLEAFTIVGDGIWLRVFIMDGDVRPSDFFEYWTEAQATTSSRMDFLGGEVDERSGWGVYSSTHYLSYRVFRYAEFQTDWVGGFHVAVVLEGSEGSFVDDLTWAQSAISVDGKQIWPSLDLARVSTVATGEGEFEPEDISVRWTTVEDWSSDGLISETEWQGPIHGTSFSWDEHLWQFTFNRSDAIVISHEYMDEMLILETPDQRGMVKLRTMETVDSPSGWVNWWLSDAYKEADSGFEFTVIDSVSTETTGSVILRFETIYGEPVVVIRDVYINDDGVTVMTEIFAAPEDIAVVYIDFWEGVMSNGDYYPLTWKIEEIEDLHTE